MMEECAEVSQRCSKALRFGLGEIQTGQELNNAQRIEAEFADLMAVHEMMTTLGMITVHLPDYTSRKQRVEKYLNMSRELGTLKD